MKTHLLLLGVVLITINMSYAAEVPWLKARSVPTKEQQENAAYLALAIFNNNQSAVGDLLKTAFAKNIKRDPETVINLAFELNNAVQQALFSRHIDLGELDNEAANKFKSFIKYIVITRTKQLSRVPTELELFFQFHPGERETIIQYLGYDDLVNLVQAAAPKTMMAEALKNEFDKRHLIHYWATGQIQPDYLGNPERGGVELLSISKNNEYIAGAGFDERSIALYDVKKHKYLYPPDHIGQIYSVVFTADGKLLTFECELKTLKYVTRLSNVQGKEIQVKKLPITFGASGALTSSAFSNNGKFLVVGFSNGSIRLFDIHKDEEIKIASPHYGEDVLSLAISPNGTRLAAVFFMRNVNNKILLLWDVQTGQEIRELKAPYKMPCSIAFSPDGTLFATGWAGEKTGIRLFEMYSGEEIRTIGTNNQFLRSVVFSPDGKQIAAGYQDWSITLFKVIEKGEEVRLQKKE